MGALPSFELVAVGVIMLLVQAIRTATGLRSRYLPLLSIACGLLAGAGYVQVTGEGSLAFGALHGLLAALSASGLYSGIKAQAPDGVTQSSDTQYEHPGQ